MHQTLARVLLLLSLSAASGKYIYVGKVRTWPEAQEYCRRHYTELAPVSSTHDVALLRDLIDQRNRIYGSWIGMKRSDDDSTKWFWSGAGEVTKFLWADGQPDDHEHEDYGLLYRDEWHDAPSHWSTYFFCYKVFVVREEKTWEEAVQYCREHHHDLASVASDAEMTLIWRELGDNTTDHVWIGLHFFPGYWLWTDGQPMDYDAWSKEGKPGCPDVRFECAALRMRERVQSTNGTNGTNSTLVGNAMGSFHPGAAVFEGNAEEVEEVEEKVWEAYDCEKKLFFVCY